MRLVIAALALLIAAALPLAAQDAAPRPLLRGTSVAPTDPYVGDGSNPLVVSSDTFAQVQVGRQDVPASGIFDNQYQTNAETYVVATASGAGVATIYSGDPADASSGPFSGVSNTANTGSSPQTLVTVVSDAAQLQVTHTISYASGSQLIQHTWVITNQNSNRTQYDNVQLRYGGDISYAGQNPGVGVHDQTSGHLYVGVPGSPGLMEYYADASSPWSHYLEAPDVEAALNNPAAALGDTVAGTYQNSAGMGVEWDLGTLAWNASKTVILYEAWDTPNQITVTPPSTMPVTVPTNQATNLAFTLVNGENASDTFAVDMNAGSGLSTSPIATSVTLAAHATQVLTVPVTGLTAGIPESTISVLARSTTNAAFVSQAIQRVEQAACALSAPSSLQLAPATMVNVPVSIESLEPGADTFTLGVAGSAGVTIASATFPGTVTLGAFRGALTRAVTVVPYTGPISIQLQPLAPVNFTLQCSVAANAATPASITVSGQSATASAPVVTTATIPITIVISSGGPTGGTVTLPAPSVAVSTADHVVFYPLSPATTAGAVALEAFLDAAVPADNAVGFCWDATLQSYVEYPALPVGGLQPTTGMFVATAVPMDVDFSGTPAATSAAITLQPGWNLVGVPPISTGGLTVTSVHFPADFTLQVGGVSVTSAAIFADDLGTAGSDQPATAEPWFYNGSGYDQVSQLDAGTAYWFQNHLSSAVTLQVNPGTINPLLGAHRSPRTASSGSPPPAPSTAPAAAGATSGRCGAAAGVVLLVSLALWWRRRRT